MSDLGVDVAALTETRLDGTLAHSAAISGMWDAGYLCISHNVSSAEGRTACPQSSGVALAVKRDVATDWANIQLGPHGRALGGSLCLQNGAVLRIVAVYGPTGACLPGFTQNARAVQHETDLVSFLQGQVAMAQANDWTLVVLGDLNSFTDGALDKWQGHWQVRDECLAVQCRELGLIDAWRDTRPALPGFTYVSPTGSASRLDSIWILPAVGFYAPVLNASLLWNWHKRVDHHPVIVDLGVDIPTAPAAISDLDPPRWRQLAQLAHSQSLPALKEQVAAKIEAHRLVLSQAALCLREAVTHCSDASESLSELGMVAGQSPQWPAREAACSRVHHAHDAVMAILHQTLPQTSQPNRNRKLGRALGAWDTCLAELRSLKLVLRDSMGAEPEAADVILQRANNKWCQGLHFLDKRGQVMLERQAWDWDGFHSQLEAWLRSLSAPGLPQLLPSAVRPPDRGTVVRRLQWTSTIIMEIEDRLLQVEDWMQAAQTLRAQTAAWHAREGHGRRVNLLRSGDLRRWARYWRTPSYKRLAYTPQLLTTASGARRPKTPAEMRKAAAQEWQKLFDRPRQPWSHALVHAWTDPSGLLRGSPRTQDVQAPADALHALLNPGPWTRCVFRGNELQRLPGDEIRIQLWRFRSVGGLWEGKLLGPCEGPVHYMWCMSTDNRRIFSGPYGIGLIFRSKLSIAFFFSYPVLYLNRHRWAPSVHMTDPGGCPKCRLPDQGHRVGNCATCASTPTGLGPGCLLALSGHSTGHWFCRAIAQACCPDQHTQAQGRLAAPHHAGRGLQSHRRTGHPALGLCSRIPASWRHLQRLQSCV